VHDEGGFEAVVALFDSTITFHAQYQQSREMSALLDLLVLDRDNPRSLGWVAQTLRGRLAKLAACEPAKYPTSPANTARPATRDPGSPVRRDADGRYTALIAELLDAACQRGLALSDAFSARYFTHSGDARQSLGA
jgi:uncharacterized alpha-E superfamily protein